MSNEEQKISEEQLQQMYMQFQMLKGQMDEGLQNKQILDQKMAELVATKNAVIDLKKVKNNTEVWTSLGSDTYTNAKLADTSKVVISVGSGVIVKKNTADALKILDKKEKELQELDKKIMIHIQQLQTQMQVLENAMQSAISQSQEINKNKLKKE